MKKINFNIKIPTKEEMKITANKWWDNHKHIEHDSWCQEIRDIAYPFYSVPMPLDIIQAIIDIADTGNPNKLINLIREHDILGEYRKEKLFIKLSSRSPKDAFECDTYGKPFPVSCIEEGILKIAKSMRTFDDLCLFRHIPEKCRLIIKPYFDFPPRNEWRVFVVDGAIEGISQYYYDHNFNYSQDYIDGVCSRIIEALNIISINLPIDKYVADFVIPNDAKSIKLIEINPYGLSDPCLFETYDNLDGDILYNGKT